MHLSDDMANIRFFGYVLGTFVLVGMHWEDWKSLPHKLKLSVVVVIKQVIGIPSHIVLGARWNNMLPKLNTFY